MSLLSTEYQSKVMIDSLLHALFNIVICKHLKRDLQNVTKYVCSIHIRLLL